MPHTDSIELVGSIVVARMAGIGAKASADPSSSAFAVERAHVDERGAVGLRPEPAAAIVRRH